MNQKQQAVVEAAREFKEGYEPSSSNFCYYNRICKALENLDD